MSALGQGFIVNPNTGEIKCAICNKPFRATDPDVKIRMASHQCSIPHARR